MANIDVSALSKRPDFGKLFEVLTGHAPFPWQAKLFAEWLAKGKVPSSCSLPTGLGKTSVMAIWLIALAYSDCRLPRRLVYVVNRRTVVDQATREAEKLRRNLQAAGLAKALNKLCGIVHDTPLAISTLRGQFADNAEWRDDPARPAIIIGTVDMIGSRLLFSGYGCGFRSAPLHAGFLGQDAMLIHDEAHLEPAFQNLITAIEAEQERCKEFASFRVMELTATTRNGRANGECVAETFGLSVEDREHHIVERRINARKYLTLSPVVDDKAIAKQVADIALKHKGHNVAVLVFVRTLGDVKTVYGNLTDKKTGVPKEHVQQLTGTMRSYERDQLVKSNPVFARFMPPSDRPQDVTPAEGTVYLVCTSAGEVGIDISADHMVCDLSTFDSMTQRLGRVNRYGDRTDTRVDVVHPKEFGKKDAKHDKSDKIDLCRQRTLELLTKLPAFNGNGHDASPLVLSNLNVDECIAAFAPEPVILPATDILFDAWALTSIRNKMPGRPPVEAYLHGIRDWEPPRTNVAWREEVDIFDTDELRQRDQLEDLLEEYPLKPHELLNDTSERVYMALQSMADRIGSDCCVWLVGERGEVEALSLGTLVDDDKKRAVERIANCTILLPPSVGGLSKGMLDGTSECANDVADIPEGQADRRIRIWSDDEGHDDKTNGMRLVRSIEMNPDREDDTEPQTWDWYKFKPLESGRTARQPIVLGIHAKDVESKADRIVAGLSLPDEIAQAVRVAARLHDHGKRRAQFQVMLGNRAYPGRVLAKSGLTGARLPETYRHEFGSLTDAVEDAEFKRLPPQMRDLALHLIAAHHGRARPHFPMDEAYDPDHATTVTDKVACEVPRRFARLQRQYGRWGLAYLESLLRAADWAASAEPSAFETQATEAAS